MRQNPILFPHWSVKENLQFAANYSQNTTNWQGLLEALHCQHLLEKYPNELSGGEKQRVAFIRTLLQIEDNGLVLLDEPFNALDHVTRKRALRLLETHKKNALIFMVTHDVHEIYQYADDMILIDQGRIIYHGHVTQAMSADKFHLPVASRLKIKQTIMIIYADDVSITLQQNPNSSIMHQMMANITEISITDCSVLMALSITSLKNTGNNTLLAKITKQSLHNLQLRKGQQVYACFKASSYQTDK